MRTAGLIEKRKLLNCLVAIIGPVFDYQPTNHHIYALLEHLLNLLYIH